MLTHPQIDPIAVSLGPFAVRWYGLMYVIAFVLFIFLGRRHLKRRPDLGFTTQDLDDLVFYGFLGVFLGGRLGYVLFYKFSHFVQHPIEIFYIWTGGMSFHGGFLGVLVAMWLYARKTKRTFFQVTDFIAPLVPTGLGAGRLGNFINGELPGRVTEAATWPWAMWYKHIDPLPTARHPSSLYQLIAEGVVLFVIMWWFSKEKRPIGAVSAMFLIGYGTLRFLTEFAREPDEFLGLLKGFSMGQWLSAPMALIGVIFLVRLLKKR